jgi:hypothetical protein
MENFGIFYGEKSGNRAIDDIPKMAAPPFTVARAVSVDDG